MILSKISQSHKEKYYVITPFLRYLDKILETEKRMVVARSWREMEMRSYGLIGTRFKFSKLKRVMGVDGSDIINTFNTAGPYT